MPNEVLSLPVAGATIAASAVCVALSSRRVSRKMDEARLPMLGVLGAFVFAAQMVNFQILGASSGHLGGGPLLAILLGPAAATLAMTAILAVQAFVFNDGGVLALGANILNMGVVPCWVAWAVYRAILGRPGTAKIGRLYIAIFLGAFVGMVSGAACVPIEIALSGVSRVPFATFLAVMMGVHVLIGAVEGVVTFAVVLAVFRLKPEMMPEGMRLAAGKLSARAVAVTVLVVAFATAGLLSFLASDLPDGLEYVLGEESHAPLGQPVVAQQAVSHAAQSASHWQEGLAPLPDYSLRPRDGRKLSPFWTSFSGIVGTVVVLVILYLVSAGLSRRHAKEVGADSASP
ncbi:MAG: energy-coupling factor ABC transporter permease [Planctomycetota bacterium]